MADDKTKNTEEPTTFKNLPLRSGGIVWDTMRDLVNRETSMLLGSVGKILGENFEPYFPHNPEKSCSVKPFYDKISHLIYDNNSIDKSIKRGYRDLIKGNPIKTEMKQRIKEELLDPLREYINRDDIETKQPKDKINADLDAIEEKLVTTSKAR